jgi:hypothetical protein
MGLCAGVGADLPDFRATVQGFVAHSTTRSPVDAMTDRRFNDEEVAAIFAKATEEKDNSPGQRRLPSNEGLTLAELQAIGREAGIAPERVSQAVAELDRQETPTSRRFLGLPLGVGRTVDLGRRMSDEEWERLVVDLRETFDARGTVRQEGAFRQWTNGNLQALVEPTPTGHRIRLRTTNASLRALMIGGLGMLGIAGATSVAAMLTGVGEMAVTVTQLGVMGAGMFALGAARVPGWARLRRRQMEDVAKRLTPPATVDDEDQSGTR